jgi:hypothetical protein
VVQTKVVVSAFVPSLETPMTWNVAERGSVKHAVGVVRSPRSIDHRPPGVSG